MDKINREDATLEKLVLKINEIVDCLNAINELEIVRLKRELNEILYGRFMTDEEVIIDMKFMSPSQ